MRTESAAHTSQSSPATLINAQEFISTLQPSLTQGNLEQTLRSVGKRWTCPQIVELLKDRSPDVRKVAALALSAIGDKSAIVPLAVALHDADAMVSQMAEHA